MIKKQMDNIYGGMRSDEIPWMNESPPGPVAELVESGVLGPCRAADLGAGAGRHALWLAAQGFDVTGIDISEEAVRLARENARRSGLGCEFVAADLTREGGPPGLSVLAPFDFAYDWGVLHHVFPRQRRAYVENVAGLLRGGGLYLSASFSEEDPGFGGSAKYRRTPLGTTLYFSSAPELVELFSPLFDIRELRTVEIRGRFQGHLSHCVLMRKK